MGLGVHRNDLVMVLAGKDRGRQGTVMHVMPREHKVVVEGVNVVTRHIGQSRGVSQTGRTQKEAPIDLSNVRVVCKSCNRPTRIGTKFLEVGTKVRFCKLCNENMG